MRCLTNARWRHPVFRVGSTDYLWLDVLLAAMTRGDWDAFGVRLSQGLACAAEAEANDDWPDAEVLEDAATAFRYEHNLLTSDETSAWLGRSDLTMEHWTDALVRTLLRARWADRLDEISSRHPVLPVDVGVLAAEGLCSGSFQAFAHALATRASVSAAASSEPSRDGPALPSVAARVRATQARWLEGLDDDDLSGRLSHLADLDARYAAETAAALTDSALAAHLDRHRLDWIRVDLERLSFDTVEAAHEAVLCVRVDGLSLSEVAIESQKMVYDTRDLLEHLEDELRDAVLSAQVDELVGPVEAGGAFVVVHVVGKTPPTLADSLVRGRAERSVIETLGTKAVLTHVRWADRSSA